jgi:hypothetical protein
LHDDFRQAITPLQRFTRRLLITPGDPGPLPVTKLGGVPWWPLGTPRPRCADGHSMAFLAQVRLADVPAFSPDDLGLLSFHFCEECMAVGKVAFGSDEPPSYPGAPAMNAGFDLRIFSTYAAPTDGLGMLADGDLPAMSITFADRLEVPVIDDLEIDYPHVYALLPKDWYSERYGDAFDGLCHDAYGFDADAHPGLIHVPTSKVGGWPTWVQYPEWPIGADGDRLCFVMQIDHILGDNTCWQAGGNAFFFVSPPSRTPRVAKWKTQTT